MSGLSLPEMHPHGHAEGRSALGSRPWWQAKVQATYALHHGRRSIGFDQQQQYEQQQHERQR